MKISVLSSGSKGNTTYVESNGTRILIDAGNTAKYINSALVDIGVDPKSIDAILITHTHVDHISGLKTLLKSINPTIYMTSKMHLQLDFITNYNFIDSDSFKIGNVNIKTIKTSHDVDDSLGYILDDGNSSVVYITDTGYINRKYFDVLCNKSIYIMESNHDVEMLNNSSYPFMTRKRILSDKGHLSNYDSAKYLSSFIGSKTKVIILAHLSHENNTYELALGTLRERLVNDNIKFDNIIISGQNERTELIEI